MPEERDFKEVESSLLNQAVVTSSTRRFVSIINSKKEELLATASRKLGDLIPGDKVLYNTAAFGDEQAYVHSVEPRKNCLSRSYFGKSKLLAANISELWITIAPPPLFNSKALDRTLAVAFSENIPTKILANKSDLSSFCLLSETLEYYENIGIPVIKTSTLTGEGIDKCCNLIEYSEIVVVTGISGVGKSSLLKKILKKDIRTGQVSDKTGQGKQTTSVAQAYIYDNPSANPNQLQLVIDLPGIQSFGVSHLNEESLISLIPDILKYSKNCKFDNCSHLKEVQCGVKEALAQGKILTSRYESFLEMLEEIRKSNKF
jgi:ribosome biogenesis GTPase